MVVSLSDIKHLELMDGLAERQAAPKSAETIEKASGLTPKLLRLANSLRANGFEDYALNIEDKMMRIKRAQTIDIYKAHKETGEDLVNEAHPDGDWSVGSGEGDLGDVETIVSNFKKMRKIVEKMPTGKLAAVVEMCKVVLGEGAPTKPSSNEVEIKEDPKTKLDAARVDANAALDNLEKFAKQVDLNWTAGGGGVGGWATKLYMPWTALVPGSKAIVWNCIREIRSDLAEADPKLPTFTDALENVETLITTLSPKLADTPLEGAQGATSKIWNELLDPTLKLLKRKLTDAYNALDTILSGSVSAPGGYSSSALPTKQFMRGDEYSRLIHDLKGIKEQWDKLPKTDSVAAALKWFGDEQADISNIKSSADVKKIEGEMMDFAKPRGITYSPSAGQ